MASPQFMDEHGSVTRSYARLRCCAISDSWWIAAASAAPSDSDDAAACSASAVAGSNAWQRRLRRVPRDWRAGSGRSTEQAAGAASLYGRATKLAAPAECWCADASAARGWHAATRDLWQVAVLSGDGETDSMLMHRLSPSSCFSVKLQAGRQSLACTTPECKGNVYVARCLRSCRQLLGTPDISDQHDVLNCVGGSIARNAAAYGQQIDIMRDRSPRSRASRFPCSN